MSKEMIDILEWNWIVDTEEMTCRNAENEVTVKMNYNGENLRGMLRNMPIELFSKISKYRDGELIIKKIVKTAEEHFKAALKNR